MKRLILGFLAAAFVHLLILLFGGIFFLGSDDPSRTVTVKDVDVLDVDDEKKDEKKEEKPEELEKRKEDEVEEAQEKPPDMQQLVDIEKEAPSLADATPQLSALSLSALESALAPGAGRSRRRLRLDPQPRVGGADRRHRGSRRRRVGRAGSRLRPRRPRPVRASAVPVAAELPRRSATAEDRGGRHAGVRRGRRGSRGRSEGRAIERSGVRGAGPRCRSAMEVRACDAQRQEGPVEAPHPDSFFPEQLRTSSCGTSSPSRCGLSHSGSSPPWLARRTSPRRRGATRSSRSSFSRTTGSTRTWSRG